MTITDGFRRVGVVGCGQMGTGIADVCPAGTDVVAVDSSRAASQQAETRLAASLAKAVRAGKLDEAAAQQAEDRVRFADSSLSRILLSPSSPCWNRTASFRPREGAYL